MNPVSAEHLGGDDWQTVRDLRLAALQDSPHAFWARGRVRVMPAAAASVHHHRSNHGT